MHNPYAPPRNELADVTDPHGARGVAAHPVTLWLRRLLGIVLIVAALFLLAVATFGVLQEYAVDGYDLEEVLAILLMVATAGLWLRAAGAFWHGRPRAWLWLLAPLGVFLGLFLLLTLWELVIGLP